MKTALLPLLLLSLAPADLAAPPEQPSGRMVFDKVAAGFRKYRKETDTKKHIKWPTRLAPTHDPPVAVALMDADDEAGSLNFAAVRLRGHMGVEGNSFAGKGLCVQGRFLTQPDTTGTRSRTLVASMCLVRVHPGR
jgi:hypothetical protein